MCCGHCVAVCPEGAVKIDGLANDLGLAAIGAADEAVSGAEPLNPGTLIDLMMTRRSCRNYQIKPVDRQLLADLARVGTTAPSGTNCQGWGFHILYRRDDVIRLGEAVADYYRELNSKAINPWFRLLARLFAGDRLSSYYKNYYETVARAIRDWDERGEDRLFHGAPAAIVVTADETSSCPVEDALLATQNILLAAHAVGLGTCLIGFVVEAGRRDERIRALLRLAENDRICSVIACGHPDVIFYRPAGRKPVSPTFITLAT
jgi:nitroreductase